MQTVNKVTLMLMSNVFKRKYILSKYTGTSNAGIWGGIYPTGVNTSREHRPYNQLFVNYTTWHTITLQIVALRQLLFS